MGEVDAIVQDDVRLTDVAHVPAYYTDHALECDFWYRLLDLRRLVADDTSVVIAKLKALRNLGYEGLPVSLYGGMVDLPLIVERSDDELYFAFEAREAIIGERLWAEADAESVGVGTMERELRENLLGDEAWLALDPAARTFIASSERIFRDQRSDPAFDYGPIVANFAKALEVTCNAILRRVGASAAPGGAHGHHRAPAGGSRDREAALDRPAGARAGWANPVASRAEAASAPWRLVRGRIPEAVE